LPEGQSRLRLGLGALVIAVLGGAIAVVLYSAVGPSSTTTVVGGDAGALPMTEVYDRTYQGVVNLNVTENPRGATQLGGNASQTVIGEGTGFVYDTQGDIVTAYHVVANTKAIVVEFWNDQTFPARIVQTDSATDLAIVKVDAPASLLHPLQIADSGTVKVGDAVAAIGSPYGLHGSLSTGVVSALDRQINPNGSAIPNTIQTDAAINPGSSGGPLLNDRAQVIGLSSQTQSQGGVADGVSFAIPSSTMLRVLPRLAQGQVFQHAYLGVSSKDSAKPLGAYVATVVPGSPAALAGLEVSDGITMVGSTPILNSNDLDSAIDSYSPNAQVKITYVRGNGPNAKTHTVEITLSSAVLEPSTGG
jgi:S1-C subfamily serine protease